MRLVDTHCHIHSADYPLDSLEVLARAREAGVDRVVCIGTSVEDSRRAVKFAEENERVYATVGVHPSEWVSFDKKVLKELTNSKKVVAVGEIGLDYHYAGYDSEKQIGILEEQLEMAVGVGLPVVFHVREAYEDFWRVVEKFPEVKGELHSFSDTDEGNLRRAMERGFYFGVNGIITFTKDLQQLEILRKIPLEKILLETDAPYLTPNGFRGTINEPRYVKVVVEWEANDRRISLEELAGITNENAKGFFGIK